MEVSLNLYCCCKFPTEGSGQEEERIEEASSNTCEDQFTCSSVSDEKERKKWLEGQLADLDKKVQLKQYGS
jgi:hypothetical protein